MNSRSILILAVCLMAGAAVAAFGFAEKNNLRDNIWEGYDAEWRKADSLENAGLPKSALEVVEEIYGIAKNEKNSPQIIKSLSYKAKYISSLEENGYIKAIRLFEDEIETATVPTKNVLQSMLAQMYWGYYSSHSWQIMERTQTTGIMNEDIETWDLRTLNNKILELYSQSVADKSVLQKTNLRQFDEIIDEGDKYGHFLRQTLFDFLAHRAIEFLVRDDLYLTQPAYRFELTDPKIFDDNKSFANHTFGSTDSAAQKLLAIHLLQDLTNLHLADPNPAALIDLDLIRYEFGKNNYRSSDGDSLYLKALLSELKKYSADSSSTRVSYELAGFYYDQATNYDRLSQENTYKWELKKAVEVCNDAIARFPSSFGGVNCRVLQNQILSKQFEIESGQVNVPGKPFLASVQYKNMSELSLRLIKLEPEEIADIRLLGYDERLSVLLAKPVYKEWKQTLPDDGDHQQHVAEIKIDALPLGSYFLIAGVKPEFNPDSNLLSAVELWISDLSFIRTSGYWGADRSEKEFYITDRTSGAPIRGATVQTYRREYDPNSRTYKKNLLKSYTSDENGRVVVSNLLMDASYHFMISITNGKDHLPVDESFYISKEKPEILKPAYNTYFFTDRSIYRPGQIVYFKGIVVEESGGGKSKAVAANYKTEVTFYDVNRQRISSIVLTTNEYGSFSGTFTAPASGLHGNMNISNESGSVDISVEEYKRPGFSVSFDQLTQTYALGDTVNVTGVASSYAGASIDQAMVQYRVVRTASYPYFYDYYGHGFRKIFPPVAERIITSGLTTTDVNGKFQIDFVALPDLSIDKELKPVFNYRIEADITDVAGETRSNSTYVTSGYLSITADVTIAEIIYTDKPATIKFVTANLNGNQVPATGTIKIFPLDAPDQLIRPRSFSRPDKFTMTENEFHKLFPLDEYSNESNRAIWPVLPAVQTIQWNTAISDSAVVETKNLKPGTYKLVLTTLDKSGVEIKSERYFDVLTEKIYAAYPQYQLPVATYQVKQPGETAIVKFGSSAQDVMALVRITKGNGEVTSKWIHLPDEKNKGITASMTDLEFTVEESDRGGFRVQISFIKDSRFFTQLYQIDVPWDNKDLKVILETHRDKLDPGAEETWKIKISGNKGERVAAEMLASMYDASLDQFRGHYWSGINWPSNYLYDPFDGGGFGNATGYKWNDDYYFDYGNSRYFSYDQLNWFGFDLQQGGRKVYYLMNQEGAAAFDIDGAPIMDKSGDMKSESLESNGNAAVPEVNFDMVTARSNLNETAFFYPHLETDAEGNIIFSFKMPEGLTTWNFKAFAHTKDLMSRQIFSSVVTQKELMIQPNAPRFLREGDEILFTAKISNLSDSALSGVAQLELFNAKTMEPVDVQFNHTSARVNFTATEKQSTSVSWKLKVPDGIETIIYRVKAVSGNFTDGEQNAIPILTNRILITESMPMWVRGNKEKLFSFDRLLGSTNSSTLHTQSITVEYTSNPTWYAVQALPYMMEYPYECAEQVFNRYYSNSIAYTITKIEPDIKRVFESWKSDPDALQSNLEKNQELKTLLLEETPWVLQAQNESERKKRIALLFDENRMSNEMKSSVNKLKQLQLPNGGWPWFKGYEDDRYITQYIVVGIAHLKQLKIFQENDRELNSMLESALRYTDERMYEDYLDLQKSSVDKSTYHTPDIIIQYLYARSYFKRGDEGLNSEYNTATTYYIGQLKKYWTSYSLYQKGMIALIMLRNNDSNTAAAIVKSLREYSLNSAETGMYWKDNVAGYYWYQAPIETQALMIEVFDEVARDEKAVEDLKVWLLRQKQTNDWKTTKATAEACYALLMKGRSLLADKDLAIITVGKLVIQNDPAEAGTGYVKHTWSGNEANPEFGNILIKPTKGNEVSWGAMYWQYFENIDKVTASLNDLQIKKQLFVKETTNQGAVLVPINENTGLSVGDLLTVRIEIRVDRDMEYVHMKDMRASGFEPVNVLSGYKWQDGLGYYESTGDAATNFFFARLPKGTWVFEYQLRVAHQGDFSNGVTTIQCMYAPEFTSHSEGIRVKVED